MSKKTLPPGKYIFEFQEDSGGKIMIVRNSEGTISDEFVVRQSESKKTPTDTELIFRRYGDKEFLGHIFERGNKIGVAVAEPSKLEKELQAQRQRPTEHSESG